MPRLTILHACTPDRARALRRARQLLLCVFLLWLAGIGLRITILAVPPVIPLIRTDFGMSETQVGILTGLPQVLFACTAVLGSLLIARFGALATLIAGLFATAAGSALRGVAPDVVAALCRDDRHRLRRRDHAALAAAAGAQLAAASHRLRHRGVHQWIAGRRNPSRRADHSACCCRCSHDSWRASFVVWAVPVALIALVILLLAPRQTRRRSAVRAQRWWPDWSDPLIWKLGIALGSANAMYFTANAFLPDYLHHIGRAGSGQRRAHRAQCRADPGLAPAARDRRHGSSAASGRMSSAARPRIAAVIGIMVLPGPGIVACAGVLGFFAAAILILMLAMPALLAPPGRRASRAGGDVHHQLFVRRDHAGVQRACLGPDRHRAVGLRAARRLRRVLIVVAPTIRFAAEAERA